jgi:hypothetical protein
VITSPSTSSVAAIIMLLGKLDQIRGERFSTNQKKATLGLIYAPKVK